MESRSGESLVGKRRPPPWVRLCQTSIGLVKTCLGLGVLGYLAGQVRKCAYSWESWYIMATVVLVLDGLEMVLGRYLGGKQRSRWKACVGCIVLWTGWLLSLCYPGLLIWGSILLAGGSPGCEAGVWGVTLVLCILFGIHSAFTFIFSCKPLCLMCLPLLGTIDTNKQPATS